MRVLLVNPRYPYEKDHIFLNGSICSIGARLLQMGHEVDVIDLNIDRIEDSNIDAVLRRADRIGISLTGSPYIPRVLELVDTLRSSGIDTPILLGGQVIEQLERVEFAAVIGDRVNVYQIRDAQDLARQIGCGITDIPSPVAVSFVPLWNRMGEETMMRYLRQEATLVVSQGCNQPCAFCAAKKNMVEAFREIGVFEKDLRYLAGVALCNGLSKLEFYASSLDFFQNPLTVAKYLAVLARIREDSKIDIRVRCLSRLQSFIDAAAKIPNLADLLREAGLWCVGFGADGTDPGVWKAQKKANKQVEIVQCLDLCEEYGVTPELLMVIGFPEDDIQTLLKTLWTSVRAVIRWPTVVIRPYLAKPFVPGNEGWDKDKESVAKVVVDPTLFYNLDFACVASPLTHPRRFHRYACSIAYLLLCGILGPMGKSTTSPLFPQGGRGILAKISQAINRLMPFDR